MVNLAIVCYSLWSYLWAAALEGSRRDCCKALPPFLYDLAVAMQMRLMQLARHEAMAPQIVAQQSVSKACCSCCVS